MAAVSATKKIDLTATAFELKFVCHFDKLRSSWSFICTPIMVVALATDTSNSTGPLHWYHV